MIRCGQYSRVGEHNSLRDVIGTSVRVLKEILGKLEKGCVKSDLRDRSGRFRLHSKELDLYIKGTKQPSTLGCRPQLPRQLTSYSIVLNICHVPWWMNGQRQVVDFG